MEHRPRLTAEEYDVIRELRGELVSNINSNTALDIHLSERGIDKKDVTSVKHWQSASGELRFSVVTKESAQVVSLEKRFKPILEELRSYSPKFDKIKRTQISDPHCIVFDPSDIHVGKLASRIETGESYNISKAVSQVDKAIDGLILKANGFNIDKVVLVMGNDVLHTDNGKTTTSGTPQDTDGTWHQAFTSSKRMYVRTIEKLLSLADVHVIFCPSNHDYMSGWMLAQTIEAYFRKSKNVTFDSTISHRKYFSYGTNMISLSHGDGAKLIDIPLLVATERPEMWNKSTYRYIYLHHIHHKQTHKFMSGKDFIGITAEYLRSPSPADSWHHRNGYVGAKKAIEAFIHSLHNGQVARLTHHV
tara:strand:+ start:5023 stop:6105 length:1083 start_codon:yes stop_codon:yes gene_type:complete